MLKVVREDRTLTITFNRPDKANAMNQQMLEELLKIIDRLRYDQEIQFVVFKGEGKHFSGGADLNELVAKYEAGEFTPDAGRKNQYFGHEIMSKLEELEQITFAAVQGACVGGGLALALACDFRIATEEAYFFIPEIHRGTFYTWGSTARLINTVGVTKAKELILLAEPLPADEALAAHLATRVVKEGGLDEKVQELIDRMSQGPFTPIRMTKKLAHAAGISQLKHIMTFDSELFAHALLTGEPIEEMEKFVNRDRK